MLQSEIKIMKGKCASTENTAYSISCKIASLEKNKKERIKK